MFFIEGRFDATLAVHALTHAVRQMPRYVRLRIVDRDRVGVSLSAFTHGQCIAKAFRTDQTGRCVGLLQDGIGSCGRTAGKASAVAQELTAIEAELTGDELYTIQDSIDDPTRRRRCLVYPDLS